MTGGLGRGFHRAGVLSWAERIGHVSNSATAQAVNGLIIMNLPRILLSERFPATLKNPPARRLDGGWGCALLPGQLGRPPKKKRDVKQFDPATSLCAGTDPERALGLIHHQLYQIPE